jgi:hypothetical protein
MKRDWRDGALAYEPIYLEYRDSGKPKGALWPWKDR